MRVGVRGAGYILLLLLQLSVCQVRGSERAKQRFVGYRSGFHYDTMSLQIQLERRNLSPGCIDGVWGRKSAVALMAWQLSQGMRADGVPTAAILESLGSDTNVLVYYTITTNDHAALGVVPSEWEARARLKAMSYETVLESVAEKSHASQRMIERLNPDIAWPNPEPGTRVVVPECSAERVQVATTIRISLSRFELTAFSYGGELIALFPCSIARERSRRPRGETRVSTVAPNPNYTYDPKLFEPYSGKTRRLVIPPGPNNPVGMAWIGLALKGYGIHGTPNPEQVGRAESMGCFRLTNWNALKLLQMVERGTPVIIEE